MSTISPLIVLADDLTGAAEIAAIAHRAGLRAIVVTTLPKRLTDADVMVCDTETRLLTPARAARRIRLFVKTLLPHKPAGFFKKTDSVLRGPVLAELAACATALGLSRTLLVPCNPSLGRIIHNGRYFIAGTPLHKTSFARDPLHPRRTSDVRKLLDPDRNPSLGCYLPADRLPATGVLIGEADSPADVVLWASRVTKDTLAAGGADFFRAWLATRREPQRDRSVEELPDGAALLLSGTASPVDPLSPLPGMPLPIDPRRLAMSSKLAVLVRDRLERENYASIHIRGPLVRQPGIPAALDRTLATLAKRVHAGGGFDHLLVVGGATAAAVLRALEWSELEVVRVWGPGVVTLRSTGSDRTMVTLKPGSYAWPDRLLQQFAGATTS